MKLAAWTPWAVAALGLATAALAFNLGPYSELAARLGEAGTFDERPAASLEDARARLAAMDEGTLALYAQHLRWDLGAMVGNAALLGGLLMGVTRRWPRLARVALLAPLTLLLADGVENAGLALWLADGAWPTSLAVVTSATATKFTAVGAGGALLAVAVVARLVAVGGGGLARARRALTSAAEVRPLNDSRASLDAP